MKTSLVTDRIADPIASELDEIRRVLNELRGEVSNADRVDDLEERIATVEALSRQERNNMALMRLAGSGRSTQRIDAHLVYRYNDLLNEINVLFGLTALFVGVAIASAVGLAIAVFSRAGGTATAIQTVVTIMSTAVFMIFGYLTREVWKKAESVRHAIEADMASQAAQQASQRE
ncbi:MAG TPA: hypothetical protein PK801_10105 [Aggregatilineales bacterium]|nr:hypothetical protein [Chloroflexota bacterium]HOA25149.1 hypothetical protein [Aggregatilineales bacterium]HPV08756.1 hypothetical protein [Aggregatilineales bacterium]HQA68667.1 hypothetical protein [Aggregatilineales bacterium]HQE19267.1 hypothetical protein [Aggregatilineales bacterium]